MEKTKTKGKWGTVLGLSLYTLSLIFAPHSNAQSFGDSEGISPFWDWKTLESTHFRIYYPDELKPVAIDTAQYLEEAYLRIGPVIKWKPREKTNVLVLDNSDLGNGATAAAFRFGMILNVTPPLNWFPTSYYDNWLRLLVYHEFTHFLNLDPTSGIFSLLRLIYGDAVRPNSFWTRWMLEGFAVFNETRFTQSGRGRSPYYSMILRTAVNEGKLGTSDFITMSQLFDFYPWNPFGETPYFFGYQLFNHIYKKAEKEKLSKSADGESEFNAPIDIFGDLSIRSSERVPFFINGNLENVIGMTWPEVWEDWLQESRIRMEADLAKIKTYPVTDSKPIGRPGLIPFGAAVSPDGKWICYTEDHEDRRRGLYLKNLEDPNAKPKRLFDKYFGSQVVFTPDSKWIIGSAIRRHDQYYSFSDLFSYQVETDTFDWISEKSRFGDPKLSKTGRGITFTVTGDSRVGLGHAKLSLRDGKLHLVGAKTVYRPKRYDRVSDPVFTPNGDGIVFSLHKNGEVKNDLYLFDIAADKTLPLITNGSRLRFPFYTEKGELHFVSDVTGVDNIYKHVPGAPNEGAQRTNLISGVWFPFEAHGKFYGSVYTNDGWVFSEVKLNDGQISSDRVTIAQSAPDKSDPMTKTVAPPSLSSTNAPTASYELKDYSIFPSIWPRAWGPELFISDETLFIGAFIYGFDSTDRHRYSLSGGYDTTAEKWDWSVVYTNRSLGPSLQLYSENYTRNVRTSDGLLSSFERKFNAAASLYYPIQRVFTQTTPRLKFQFERATSFDASGDRTSRSNLVPTLEASVNHTDIESSRLSISRERGVDITVGAKGYFDRDREESYKGFVSSRFYMPILGPHIILVPELHAAYSSRRSSYADANVVISGYKPGYLENFNAGRVTDFDEISVRGYPNTSFFLKGGGVGTLELRFPIFRIYRGLGSTFPFHFMNLYAYGFGESAFFDKQIFGTYFAPSAGGGLRLSTLIFNYVPMTLSVDYQRGFQENFLGQGETSFSVLINAI